jgi:hypothetical protein
MKLTTLPGSSSLLASAGMALAADPSELPPPEVLQQEIIEHLEGALASFRDVAAGLRGCGPVRFDDAGPARRPL